MRTWVYVAGIGVVAAAGAAVYFGSRPTPEAQLEQLVPYFQVERVLELSRGESLDEKALATTDSKWVYYFCKKPG